MEANFFIPYRDTHTKRYNLTSTWFILVTSDYWIGAEFVDILDLQDIVMSQDQVKFTNLLDLQPLPVGALNNKEFEDLYNFQFFNPIQTQIFHTLYHN